MSVDTHSGTTPIKPRRWRSGAHSWPAWRRVALTAVLLVAAGAARALPNGISGYSGKQFLTCERCHDDGVPPLVEFEGLQRVLADDVVTLRFIVRSQSPEQSVAGFNVASSDGVLGIVEGQDARVADLEVTHLQPKPVDDNGDASWQFTWQAPAFPGVQRLYGAGVSANGVGGQAGDGSAGAMPFTVAVTQLGDANCDDRISAADLLAEMIHAGDGLSATCGLRFGDTDCDGVVQESDIGTVIALVFDREARAVCAE